MLYSYGNLIPNDTYDISEVRQLWIPYRNKTHSYFVSLVKFEDLGLMIEYFSISINGVNRLMPTEYESFVGELHSVIGVDKDYCDYINNCTYEFRFARKVWTTEPSYMQWVKTDMFLLFSKKWVTYMFTNFGNLNAKRIIPFYL